MKILVVGGTGTVGSQVVRELLERYADVRVLTREPDRADLPDGAIAVGGDLGEPDDLPAIFGGVDGAFLLNAVSPTESHEGLMAVNGARAARVGRLVHLSVHRVDEAPHLPHFGSKIGVEAAVRSSGLEWTVLRPNNFHQNDLWYRDPMVEHGVYPQPLGDVGLSRVDVRDIAEAAAIVLTGGGHAGETLDLVGPQVLTGDACAAAWSDALGRPVAYGGHDDLDAWEEQARQAFPAWMAYDFRLMYEHFVERGLAADDAAVERLTAILGHPPRSLAAFAEETAKAWR